MRTTRLGIFDAVPEEFYISGEKTDPDKFIDMFEAADAPFDYATYLATKDHFPESLDECDAYLITGSPCSVYDTYTWIERFDSFIRAAHAQKKPMVGICFGHQLIARALGGRVRLAEEGWLLGLHEFDVTVHKPWMCERRGTHPLYFINQDQVVELPPGAERLGGSPACPNAMLALDEHVLTLQAHPEQPLSSMHAFSRELLEDYGIERSLYDAALETMADGDPDAELFAGWITEFIVMRSDT
jgi:GMP synthase-like glutamine amidotransferase